MGNVFELAKYRKNEPAPQVVAAHNTVEFMRNQMYTLPSNESRVQYALVLMAQLTLWIIKSDYYDKPIDVIKAYVAKKCTDYSKKRSGE